MRDADTSHKGRRDDSQNYGRKGCPEDPRYDYQGASGSQPASGAVFGRPEQRGGMDMQNEALEYTIGSGGYNYPEAQEMHPGPSAKSRSQFRPNTMQQSAPRTQNSTYLNNVDMEPNTRYSDYESKAREAPANEYFDMDASRYSSFNPSAQNNLSDNYQNNQNLPYDEEGSKESLKGTSNSEEASKETPKGETRGLFSVLSAIFSRGNEDGQKTPVKADLGESSSFYYDKEMKRWVNKKQKAEPLSSPPLPPPKQVTNLEPVNIERRGARSRYADLSGTCTPSAELQVQDILPKPAYQAHMSASVQGSRPIPNRTSSMHNQRHEFGAAKSADYAHDIPKHSPIIPPETQRNMFSRPNTSEVPYSDNKIRSKLSSPRKTHQTGSLPDMNPDLQFFIGKKHRISPSSGPSEYIIPNHVGSSSKAPSIRSFRSCRSRITTSKQGLPPPDF